MEGRKQWLDGDGSNQAKPKAFVGTRDAKDRRLLGHGTVL
jgi:hypothetical protein